MYLCIRTNVWMLIKLETFVTLLLQCVTHVLLEIKYCLEGINQINYYCHDLKEEFVIVNYVDTVTKPIHFLHPKHERHQKYLHRQTDNL